MKPEESCALIEKAAQDWDGHYEPIWSLPGIVNTLLKRRLAKWASATLPRGARVLDIGCARGDLLSLIDRKRPDIELVGVDLSASMVALAKKRFPHLKVCQGNGTELPFADYSFDLVISLDTLSMLDGQEVAPALIHEACRLSRGLVAVEIKDPAILRLQLVLREALTRLWGMRWIARFLFAALPKALRPAVHIHDPEQLLTGLEVVGRLKPWRVVPSPTNVHYICVSPD